MSKNVKVEGAFYLSESFLSCNLPSFQLDTTRQIDQLIQNPLYFPYSPTPLSPAFSISFHLISPFFISSHLISSSSPLISFYLSSHLISSIYPYPLLTVTCNHITHNHHNSYSQTHITYTHKLTNPHNSNSKPQNHITQTHKLTKKTPKKDKNYIYLDS